MNVKLTTEHPFLRSRMLFSRQCSDLNMTEVGGISGTWKLAV